MPKPVKSCSAKPVAVAIASAKMHGAVSGRNSTASLVDRLYSDAMKNSGVVWTRDKLAAYIEAPKKVVSGTRMIFWGISDQEKIDNLLAYLATFQAQ
eukprot:gene2213-2508_t